MYFYARPIGCNYHSYPACSTTVNRVLCGVNVVSHILVFIILICMYFSSPGKVQEELGPFVPQTTETQIILPGHDNGNGNGNDSDRDDDNNNYNDNDNNDNDDVDDDGDDDNNDENDDENENDDNDNDGNGIVGGVFISYCQSIIHVATTQILLTYSKFN